MTMPPGKRKRSRRWDRQQGRPTGRGPRKGERKTEHDRHSPITHTKEHTMPTLTVETLLTTLETLADQARTAAQHQRNAWDADNLTELARQVQRLVNTAWAQIEP